MTINFSGVISPPGTRGTTEYVPSCCMLARKASFVSCSLFFSRIGLFQSDAKIEPAVGLQISQPTPVPCFARSSSNVLIPETFTTSYISARDKSKCSQRRLLTSTPDSAIFALKRSVMRGTQPPQPVPALVQALRSPTEQAPSSIAEQSSPLVTASHEQI